MQLHMLRQDRLLHGRMGMLYFGKAKNASYKGIQEGSENWYFTALVIQEMLTSALVNIPKVE